MKEINEIEFKIALFLRIGVVISGCLMLIGLIINFKYDGNPFFTFQFYDKIPLELSLFHHYKHRQWGALISYAGLFLLIGLPVSRVFLTACLFLKQKEYKMAILAAVVLTGLMLSFSLGIEL